MGPEIRFEGLSRRFGAVPALDAVDLTTPVAAMREANYRVGRDTARQTPEDAARWLTTKTGLAR